MLECIGIVVSGVRGALVECAPPPVMEGAVSTSTMRLAITMAPPTERGHFEEEPFSGQKCTRLHDLHIKSQFFSGGTNHMTESDDT